MLKILCRRRIHRAIIAVLVLIFIISMWAQKPHPVNKEGKENKLWEFPPWSVTRDTGPVQHVAFLKVHKSASTTVQNIFLRFGWNGNLTFVLPPDKNAFRFPNIISLNESITKYNVLPPPPNKTYDILCNHVLFSSKSFQDVLPNDTVYVGIVREPYAHLLSVINYFRPGYILKRIQRPDPVTVFLKNTALFEPQILTNSYTNNRMALEFGFPRSLWGYFNKTLVNNYLQILERQFRIVLIAERLEESVVLMRRLLRWTTKDILYLDKNVLTAKRIFYFSNEIDRMFYQTHARLDYALYNHFSERLNTQIESEGPDFVREVEYFRAIRLKVKDHCLRHAKVALNFDETSWSKAFNVTQTDCSLLVLDEMSFVNIIKKRQYKTTPLVDFRVKT